MKINIIVGSTRPNRFGITAASWFNDLAQNSHLDGVDFELIDLAEINLPLLDEPVSASQHQYANQHTKDWSAKIAEADGYIFVTPEYNHSYPASLKNAIDYLYQEWNYKPAAFVSYGAGQGGSRAIEHLRGVAAQIKMFDLPEFVSIPNYWTQMTDQGFQATDSQIAEAQAVLHSIAFWSAEMKASRDKLARKASN